MKRLLFILLVFCSLQNGYAQGDVHGALQRAHDRAVAERQKENDAKAKAGQKLIDDIVRKNKAKITQIRIIESNPDAYILTIDGTDFLFTRPEDRDNAKNRFISNATRDVMQMLDPKKIKNRSATESELRQYFSGMCSVRKGRNPNYRAESPSQLHQSGNNGYSNHTDFENNQSFNTLYGENSTQYDNVFDAINAGARNNTPNTTATQNQAPVAMNADDILGHIGKSQAPVAIDPRDMKVTPQPLQHLPQMKNTMSEGECKLKLEGIRWKLAQLELFCRHSRYIKCDAEKIEKLKQERENELNNLGDLLKGRYTEELSSMKKDLEDATEKYKNCTYEPCRTTMQKEIDMLEQKIKDNEDIDKKVKADIAREAIKQIESTKSYAEEMCEVGQELKERGDKAVGQALLDKYTPIVAAQDAYDFAKDNYNMMKDVVENFQDYYSDEDVYKALQKGGVDIVTTLGSTLIPVSAPFLEYCGALAEQSINGEKIDVMGAAKTAGINMGKGAIPYFGTISSVGERASTIIDFYSAIREVYNKKKYK